jgi:hypothetical protein
MCGLWIECRGTQIRTETGSPFEFRANSLFGSENSLGCTPSLFFQKNSLLRLQKFPVPLRREFPCKPLNSLADWAPKSRKGAGIDEIPC